ncbi:MAG: methyl-accepting chemotaxis protein [Nitrospirae bacterium]|nr:methyl-accepting chemotaxis protein [Nitrospirota bacterium]
MDFIVLDGINWKIFGLNAPFFSWLASIGLIIFPIYYFRRLYKHFRKESSAYLTVANSLATLQKEIIVRPGNGLPLSAYDSVAQIFSDAPSLLSAWSSFKSKIVTRPTKEGDDQFWATDSADTDFSESALIDIHLNKAFFGSIPGVVTGTGLLFTFLAILVALYGVKIEGTKYVGIDKLLSGLSGKFISSVAALFSATIFLITEKSIFHRLTNGRKDLVAAIDNLFPRLTQTKVLSDIHSNIAEQTRAFRLFNADLSLKLRESFSESLGPTLEYMVKTVDEITRLLRKAEEQKQDSIAAQLEALLKNVEQSIVSALRNMGSSFTDSLSRSTMDQFNKVANSLAGTSDLLNNMNGQLSGTQAAFNDLISLAKSSTAEQIALGQSQVEALTSVLRELMIQLKETTGSTVTDMSATLTAVTHNLSQKVTELGEQMSRTIRESSDNAAGAAQDVIRKAGDWTSRSAEQLDHLAGKYQSQVELTTALNDAMKSALAGFNDSLGKYGQVTGDLKQITNNVNVTVDLMTKVSSVIKQNQESLTMIAGLTKEQIDALRGANQEQKETWKEIYNSMQQYKSVFEQVENSAKELLLQISDNLTDYAEQTEGHFQSLVKVSNEHFGNAVKGLGQTVGELDELLQNLNDVLNKKK